MNVVRVMNLVRQTLLCSVVLALAAPAVRAQGTYDYTDDFSVNKAAYDCWSSSPFRANDVVNGLPGPYLYYQGTGAGRGLVFVDYRDQLARLEYGFPIGATAASRPVRGTLRFDVSFPCNSEISQYPAGQLSYALSPDGWTWAPAQTLHAGHYDIPISSTQGSCYVVFTGTRAMLDNVQVSLYAPTATLRVPHDYRTIQQAIDAAGNGDVIEVSPGTYTGPGNWDIEFRGKKVTVRSASAPQNTTIDCGKPTAAVGKRRGFYFHQGEGAESVLSGFTVRGGRVFGTTIPSNALAWPANAAHPIGGGIYCEFSSPTIVNCVIVDCGAELGGGIGCVGGEPSIMGCTIKECLAGGLSAPGSTGRGGAIALVGRCNAEITDCTIQGNSGYANSQGGGIYCYQSVAAISGCMISANFAPAYLRGGGLYCGGDGTNVTLKNCVISQNIADAGAGVSVQRTVTASPSLSSPGARCRVTLVNCTIAQNALSNLSAAGGVESAGADITIRNSIVWSNDGVSLAVTSPAVTTPVTYCNIQGGYPGTGNLNADPLFASTSTPDYHLQSASGRYDPLSSQWERDNSHSPCIDTGDPTASAAEEPAPNGNRINMGAYGGTNRASKGVGSIYHVDRRSGQDWNEGRSRATAFATLQQAIYAAQNGDVILVWPGVYEEEITFDHKAITLQSAAEAAVITAPAGYAVSFYGAESSQSVLANFVITGCGEGGIFCDGASPTLKNLTIVKNTLGIQGYGGAKPYITNCIIWGNVKGSLFNSKGNVRYNCIEPTAWDKKEGNIDKTKGNIDADPQFADWQNGDYHVRSQWGRYVPTTGTWVLDSKTSPCVDAGDPAEFPRTERMPNGRRINMGAYGGTAFASLSSGPACP